MMKKMGVRSVAELVRMADRFGVADPADMGARPSIGG